MKQYATLLFVICSVTLLAQSWKPVQSGDTYLYYVQGHGFDSTSVCIGADTSFLSGGDSVVILNKALQRFSSDTFVWMPNFLQNQITYRSNGDFILSGTTSLIVRPQQPSLVPWLADTTNSINAIITGRATMIIFGLPDSIETVSFSNGDSLVLSENFGVVYYRQQGNVYLLAGIKGRNVGVQIPDLYSLFYFIQPGDIQEYYYTVSSWNWSPPGPMNPYYSRKYTRDSLASKALNGNIMTLTYVRTYVDTSSFAGIVHASGAFTRTYDLADAHAWIEPLNNTQGINCIAYPSDTLNYVVYDTSTVFGSRTVVWSDFYLDPNTYQGGDTIPFINFIHGPSNNHYTSWQIIGDSVGIIYTSSTQQGSPMGGYFGTEQLMYARINGVEYGTPGPELNVSTSDLESSPSLGIFPNPAGDQLYFSSIESGAQIEITDALGRICIISTANSSATIDISTLTPGMYYFRSGCSVVRFVKQ